MSFTPDQLDALKADLFSGNVKQRKQAGRQLSYIEGWLAEAEANRIFGFDGWDTETVYERCVAEKPRKIGDAGVDGWAVSYVCKVRVTVRAGDKVIVREGVGAGHGIDRDLGLAHESAIKESSTDAEKRALKTFGNPFGLALYDKTQANVSNVKPDYNPDKPPPGGAAITTGRELLNRHRLSSAEANRRGLSDKIKAEIKALDKIGLGNWMARFDENTAELPLSWLDSIRDFAEHHLEDLNGADAVAGSDAELDDAFRQTMGGPVGAGVAGNAGAGAHA